MSSSGMYAVASAISSVVYYSSNYGVSWTASSSVSATSYEIAMSASGQYVVFPAYNGYIYYSSNYGHSFTQSSSGVKNWESIAMDASGQYLVVGVYNGYIYYSNDYGVTWTQSNSIYSDWSPLSMSGSGTYVLAAQNAKNAPLYHSSDYGQTWTVTSSPSGAYYRIAMSSDTAFAIATYSNGHVYYSYNYGVTWTASSSAAVANYYGPATNGQGTSLIAVVLSGGIYYNSFAYSASPSIVSTAAPSASPTAVPSLPPSANPSASPTAVPSLVPSAMPSANPSAVPSASPSAVPSLAPSAVPTASPSVVTVNPTAVPSISPTAPSVAPSASCVEWMLGYSRESCSQTCGRVLRTCSADVLYSIVTLEAFSTMVSSSVQLETDAMTGAADSFCTQGVNDYNFTSTLAASADFLGFQSPIAFTYLANELNESVRETYCNYPTSVADVKGDCDTSYLNPPAQRFCPCSCGGRRVLRNEERPPKNNEEKVENKEEIKINIKEVMLSTSPPLQYDVLLSKLEYVEVVAFGLLLLASLVAAYYLHVLRKKDAKRLAEVKVLTRQN